MRFVDALGEESKSRPRLVHSTSWLPSEVTRKRHSTVAGKSAGTSLTPGSNVAAVPTITRKTATETSAASQDPQRRIADRFTSAAATAAPIEIRIIRKYHVDRRPMVSASPTAGGFA